MAKEISIHYVCTHDEAKELIVQHDKFWVCNCGCRENNKNGCRRSRLDVCLIFDEQEGSSGSNKKSVDRRFVNEIIKEAEAKHLVSRPFRNEKRTGTSGICFCCDDCCEYFALPNKYNCDKGKLIEKTDLKQCTDCGICVDICYFKARTIINNKLQIDREKCYGCGLCVDVCPTECIRMEVRS